MAFLSAIHIGHRIKVARLMEENMSGMSLHECNFLHELNYCLPLSFPYNGVNWTSRP